MGEVIEAIWNLPWYKVFCIAAIDDAILILKTWWLWIGLIIFGLIMGRIR